MAGIGNSTFVYSPSIRVLIASQTDGRMIDVSADIVSWNLSRGTSRISTFSCQLSNKRRKYDRKLLRMARIVVYLKRTRWLQVFSGYLDTVPYETIVPGDVNIEASCTLKILENYFWDPYDFNNRALLPGIGYTDNPTEASVGQEDGGAAKGMYNVLTEIVKWRKENIFIQRIPQQFLYFASVLQNAQDLDPDPNAIAIMNERLGILLDVGGYPSGTAGARPPAGETISVADLAQVMRQAGFPENTIATGIAVAWAESNLVMTAHNVGPTDDSYGLWQFNYKGSLGPARRAAWGAPETLYNPVRAAQIALSLSSNGTNWATHWSTAKSINDQPPRYLRHLPEVRAQMTAGRTGNTSTATWALRARSSVKLDGITAGCLSMGMYLQAEADRKGIPFMVSDAKRDGSGSSYHYRGMALDLTNPDNLSQLAENQLFTEIVRPLAIAGAFSECIYNRKEWGKPGTEGYGPDGSKAFTGSDPHTDHIHVATTAETFMGHMYTPGGVDTVYGSTTGWEVSEDGIVVGNIESPFTIAYRVFQDNLETHILTGNRAFLNDDKVLSTVAELSKASMREFQSAPNGDFVAWFPDWFGIYGKTPTMVIEDIELVDCKFEVTDKALRTHVGVSGATQGYDSSVDLPEWLVTRGIVTIEQPELVKFLLGISEDANVEIDVGEFLQTFGMRPMREDIGIIRNHAWEYTYALFVFMKQWTLQYRTPISLTFMPELYPGMRIRLPETHRHGAVEMYVESVNHQGSRTGGFTTTIDVTCPTRNGRPLGLELENSVEVRRRSSTEPISDRMARNRGLI